MLPTSLGDSPMEGSSRTSSRGRVIRALPIREGVDELYPGKGVVYFSRLASRATQSRISRVASLPLYKSITIRSWSTTTKLLQLMDNL